MTVRLPTFGDPTADALAGLLALCLVVLALCAFDLPRFLRRGRRGP